MKQFKIVWSLLFVGLIFITACNESSVIGTGIIDDNNDFVNVEVGELSIRATTVLSDSVQTYRTTNQLDTYICGFMEDPLFGTYQSIFNTQVRLSRSLTMIDSLNITNLEANASLDSAFLVIELAEDFYGQISSTQEVEVYLLAEPLDNNATYYSTDSFESGDLLGSKMFTPAAPDSIVFFTDATGIDTIKPPQMQIQLDVNHPLFRDILFNGPNSLQYFQSDADLLGVLNGLQIRVSTTTPFEGLMSFDPVPPTVSTPSVTGLYVHYPSVTGDNQLYTFGINESAAKMVNFIPDYSGAIVEPFIGENEYEKGDSLIFLQGMSGLNAKLEIQDFITLENVIINKAELEFTVAADLPEDRTLFSSSPIPQFFIGTKNADGELEIITDVEAGIAGGTLNTLTTIFGGNPVEDSDGTVTYKMNVTAYLQELVNGEHETAEIFVYPALRAERPQRVVLFGPGHSEHPAKLYVTYTENQ